MQFSKSLINWYLDNRRDLPWRSSANPYHIWLSEIILQQTRVDQGIPYYYKFIQAFPKVEDLADASEEEVLKLWQGLGYYSRARNLHFSAKEITNELGGQFPRDYHGLLKLKGVGDYTASAVASICFGEAVAVLDGNVYRVLSRIFGIDIPVNTSQGAKVFKELAQQLLDHNQPSAFNQGLMEFGALQCKPQSPDCGTCPFSGTCVAYNHNRIKELPVKLKKQKAKKRHFNYVVFRTEDSRTMLQQRKGKGIWQGLYEFPLVETREEASYENLLKEEGFRSFVTSPDAEVVLYNEKPVVHKLSHQHIHTKFWIVNCSELPEEGVLVEDLSSFPVPVLIDKFIDTFDF